MTVIAAAVAATAATVSAMARPRRVRVRGRGMRSSIHDRVRFHDRWPAWNETFMERTRANTETQCLIDVNIYVLRKALEQLEGASAAARMRAAPPTDRETLCNNMCRHPWPRS